MQTRTFSGFRLPLAGSPRPQVCTTRTHKHEVFRCSLNFHPRTNMDGRSSYNKYHPRTNMDGHSSYNKYHPRTNVDGWGGRRANSWEQHQSASHEKRQASAPIGGGHSTMALQLLVTASRLLSRVRSLPGESYQLRGGGAQKNDALYIHTPSPCMHAAVQNTPRHLCK